MRSIQLMKYIASIFILSLALTALNAQAADKPAVSASAHEKVVFQVSDADQKKWNLTLNNAKNVQDGLGAGNVDVEIVVYGPGIGMLKFDSTVASRIDEAKEAGIKVVACENTMQNLNLTKNDMLSSIGYVPGGVIELMKKQKEGYAYIRP